MSNQKITPERVKKFKSDVVGACPSLVTLQEQRIVRDIPESIFENAFKQVFNGDNNLARDVLYNRFERIKYSEAEDEVKAIKTIPSAVDMISDSISNKSPMLLIVDADNDGIAAASIGMELKRATNSSLFVQTRDYNPQIHGFSITQINDWLASEGIEPNDDFTVVVADLGTNQREAQNDFLEIYPNAKLLIVDHHEPDPDDMVQQHERSVWVSPYVQGTFDLSMRSGGGASGGYLFSILAEGCISNLREQGKLDIPDVEFENRMGPIRTMGKAANVLDRVECDIRLKFLVEEDIKKVFDVAKLTGAGRSVGLWAQPIQEESINGLVDVIGAEAVADLQRKRMRLVEKNHLARALNEVLPQMLDEKIAKDWDVANLIIQTLNSITVEESQSANHVERIRPHIFNFKYENQIDSSLKNRWVKIAERCMRDIKNIEREIIETLRDYELVKEISADHTLITQASTPAVHKVFTAQQIKRAYFSTTKPLTMTVRSTGDNHIVMSATSEYNIRELLGGLEKEFPYASAEFRGHSHIGGLTLTVKPGVEMQSMLQAFSEHMNEKIVKIKELEPVTNAFFVNPFHLSIVREMLQKMRVHIEPKSAPVLLMRIDESMTFQDKNTLKKKKVSELVQERSWSTTSEALDFSRETALLIPNQALKIAYNDKFGGALGVRLIENSNYLVERVFTKSQLEGLDIPSLSTPQQKHRDSLEADYIKHFKNKEIPLVKVPREVAVKSIKFAQDPESVFRDTESAVSEVLRELDADSFVVLDVEADGGANAECFNVGLYIFKRSQDEPGRKISHSDFERLMREHPEKIRNYSFIDEYDVLVNQGLDMSIASVVIGQDGPKPIEISLTVQNLTSMDQRLISSIGCTSEEAQDKLLAILNDCGKFIIQAHNLTYDDNIMRINFPKVYDLMSEMIHLDSAGPARNHRIAYSNLTVNVIDKEDYYNAHHEGFNLNTLLRTKESFNYPSLKGKTILQVRGDVVQKFDLKTRVTTRLDMSRSDLEASLNEGLKQVSSPRYGIEKLLKMATIHDMISHQPVKQTQYVGFDGFGLMSVDDKLWKHFQDNYAYDKTPEENVLMFMRVPEVMAIVEGPSFEVSDHSSVDPKLLESRSVGVGKKFHFDEQAAIDKVEKGVSAAKSKYAEDIDKAEAVYEKEKAKAADSAKPEKAMEKCEAKFEKAKVSAEDKLNKSLSKIEENDLKRQASEKKTLSTFSPEDVLKANAIEFARANPENVERFARSWVYELVLDHHEITKKDPPKSFIEGVSEMTGLDFDIVKLCYDEAYIYKDFRGIKSMMVDETHNNVTLEGDTFQECVVFMHMLSNKLRNPFVAGEIGMRNKINPYQAVVDALRKQAAESSLDNIIKRTSTVLMDSDVLNNYSAKQLDNFSDEGISFKGLRAGTPKMKCRALSDKKTVHIEFPDLDAEKFRAMPTEDRKNLELRIETAVTTLLLSNSKNDKLLSESSRRVVTEVVTNPYLVNNLKYLKDNMGAMVPTEKEGLIKKIMKDAVSAILGNGELKLPGNKEIPPSDIDEIVDALKAGITFLEEKQNFVSYVSPSDIEEQFAEAKYEYLALQEAIETGKRVDEIDASGPLSAGAKRMQTRILNMRDKLEGDLLDVCPDLAYGIMSTKDDPAMFLLNSQINDLIMKHSSAEYGPVLKDISVDVKKDGYSPSVNSEAPKEDGVQKETPSFREAEKKPADPKEDQLGLDFDDSRSSIRR
jgi:hypothetical protein